MKVKEMQKLLEGANPEADILLKFIGNSTINITLDSVFIEPPFKETAFVFDGGFEFVQSKGGTGSTGI